MIAAVCIGAACGILAGALQPMFLGLGGFNAAPFLTAKFALVGATIGFVLCNYGRFRQRIMRRVQQASRPDPV